jgi:hypothetical protein
LKGEGFLENLAKKVLHYAKKQFSNVPEVSDSLCEERTKDRWFLVPEKLASWLSAKEMAEQDLAPIAWFSVAFAILQPEEAPHGCQVLLDRDVRFLTILFPNPGQTPDVTADSALSKDNVQNQVSRDIPSSQSALPGASASPALQDEAHALPDEDLKSSISRELTTKRIIEMGKPIPSACTRCRRQRKGRVDTVAREFRG